MEISPVNENKIDPQYLEFLQYKRFQALREQGITLDKLTDPSLSGHNPFYYCPDNNNENREGLCMVGIIRTKEELCPVCNKPFQLIKSCSKCGNRPEKIIQKKCNCGGKYKIVEVPIICPTCKTRPNTYYFDFPWQNSMGETQRIKFYKDPQTGKYFDSWQACHRFAEHIRRDMDNHGFDPTQYLKVDLEKYRFENYAWDWFDRISPNVAPNTKNTWKTILKKYLIPHFGQMDLRKIINGEIADIVSSLKIGAKYKRDIITVLRRIYNDALFRQDITIAPHFPSIKVNKPAHDWIDNEDQNKILMEIHPDDKPVFEFMILTGIRPGEVRGLKKDCIFFKERVIIIKRTFSYNILKETPKDGEWRAVPMGKRVEEILRQQIKTFLFTDYVFVNRQGRPYNRHLNRKWNEACGKAGVKISLYRGTKHSFLTQKLNQGHSLDSLAAFSGHSSTYMTQKYAKMMVDTLRPIVDDPEFVPGSSSQVRP